MTVSRVAGVGAVGIASLLFGMMAGLGLVPPHLVAMAVMALVGVYLAGRAASGDLDRWLPHWMVVGMIVKLAGANARLYVLENFYGGSGDAGRYHKLGLEIAEIWRTWTVPDMATVGFGSEGTRFIAWLTGFFYTPFEIGIVGGFWIYSVLAFIGQFFFYLAFRVVVAESHKWKKFGLLVFLWPTFVYWPAGIGKEAVIILCLGVGSWAAAHLYRRYELRWLPLVAGPAALIFIVRVHMAALFIGSLLAAAILAKREKGAEVASRRLLIGLIGLLSIPVLALGVGEKFSLDVGTDVGVEDLDPVFEGVGETTGQGGSAVSGGVISSPADIPSGVLRVLFRPLPNEAGNLQMLAASLEGTLLLGLVLWRLPSMIGSFGRVRRSPYLMFSLVYTALFIWAWSAILNLGILARQRSLVLPYLFVLVVALGWNGSSEKQLPADEVRSEPEARPIRASTVG